MVWSAVSRTKEGLMGILDTLKRLVGGHQGRANQGGDTVANSAKQEPGWISPRLSDVDSEEESEIDIERDSHL
jgi:hypothetical protein